MCIRDSPRPAISASAIAHAICGLIDEFWQDVLFIGADFELSLIHISEPTRPY